jgi:phage baseplate assembly protein W
MATIEEALLRDVLHNGDIRVTPSGDVELVSGLLNLKQALFHRLLTTPGALVHRPEYGVGIKNYQNAVNTLDTQRRLANTIIDQFQRDSRIREVSGVRISTDETVPGKVVIYVRVKAVGYDEITLDFKPFGEDQ